MSWQQPAKGEEPRAYLATETGHQIELRPNRVYLFGRDATCDLRVDDAACSRRHARLSVAGDVRTIHLEDLRSKNGTLINGMRLSGRMQLKSGDKIRIGDTEYAVWISDGAIGIELDTRTVLGQ